MAAAVIGEFADGAFQFNGGVGEKGGDRLGHFPTHAAGVRGEVELDEDVDGAALVGGGDRRVGSDDGGVGAGEVVAEEDVLAGGETEGLGRVREAEGEDVGVGGDATFAG